jgi:hypothetical protein
MKNTTIILPSPVMLVHPYTYRKRFISVNNHINCA